MMSAPLLIGTDLRKAGQSTFDILLNQSVIAVDQDPLGVQARVLSTQDGHWVFAKPLANGDTAVALFNETSSAATISTTASAPGLPDRGAYVMRDLWQHTATETAGRIAAGRPPRRTAPCRAAAPP